MRNIPIPEHRLLDYLIKRYELKNSRALADMLGMTQGGISKLRYGTNKPSPEFILRVYDTTDLSIEQIRELLKEDDGSNT
jgi:transcriptional regulator with XRE-family HTH domain